LSTVNYPLSTITLLLAAIRQVESAGNDNAVGDGGKAIGPYQIHRVYWKDGGGDPARYRIDAWHAERCVPVILAYWRRYCPAALAAGDAETMARVHNGGPGWNTGRRRAATAAYWRKVKRQLTIDSGQLRANNGQNTTTPPSLVRPLSTVNCRLSTDTEGDTMTTATATKAPRARDFFGKPIGEGVSAEAMAKIEADIAERRSRPTAEQLNRQRVRDYLWHQKPSRPEVTVLDMLPGPAASPQGCRGCQSLPAGGACMVARYAPREIRTAADLPMCHTAGRAGMRIAADNAEIMAETCGRCAEYGRETAVSGTRNTEPGTGNTEQGGRRKADQRSLREGGSEEAQGGCLGQAVRLGAGNVTAFPECLKPVDSGQ
jgi:hypothetical protein